MRVRGANSRPLMSLRPLQREEGGEERRWEKRVLKDCRAWGPAFIPLRLCTSAWSGRLMGHCIQAMGPRFEGGFTHKWH